MRELEKELENLPENFILGVVMPSDNYEDVNMHLLSHLINRKKASGSYVSISKPYNHIVDLLKSKDINTDNIHFIDCISKGLGGKICVGDKCVFVDSPSHLTDLSVALHEFFTSSGDKNRFVYIDSLSTLSIHNNLDSVLKFVHYVTGKMRIFGFNGIMLSLHEETDKKLISELGQFCDKVIHL
jgi:hypothetical protein